MIFNVSSNSLLAQSTIPPPSILVSNADSALPTVEYALTPHSSGTTGPVIGVSFYASVGTVVVLLPILIILFNRIRRKNPRAPDSPEADVEAGLETDPPIVQDSSDIVPVSTRSRIRSNVTSFGTGCSSSTVGAVVNMEIITRDIPQDIDKYRRMRRSFGRHADAEEAIFTTNHHFDQEIERNDTDSIMSGSSKPFKGPDEIDIGVPPVLPASIDGGELPSGQYLDMDFSRSLTPMPNGQPRVSIIPRPKGNSGERSASTIRALPSRTQSATTTATTSTEPLPVYRPKSKTTSTTSSVPLPGYAG